MRIHRVKKGECAADIAKEYGIDERILERCNGLSKGDRVSEGDELLIITPTRTYTAREGDSITRVALRFGASISEIARLNPHLVGEEINRGDIISVKRDERPYGLGVANGVYYKGCPEWKLRRSLPYTTYITVGSGIYDGDRYYEAFKSSEIVEIALENGKVPILRIYDKSGGDFIKDAERRKKHIEKLLNLAVKGGYRGLDLAGGKFGDGYEDFLVELRGEMIGMDMILISEIEAESPAFVSDFSDGAILGFDKCGFPGKEKISFEKYERAQMEEFANRCESTKTFIELPAFAWGENCGYIEIEDAICAARQQEVIFEKDETSMISSFKDKKRGRIEYNSLSNIASRLELLSEMGYMGISFDIGRCPISYLLMYDAMFKSVGYANVEKRVRCNHSSTKAK